MHELALCQSLLAQLERLMEEHHATGVKRAVLRIGPLSGVEPRQLEEAFAILVPHSPARGAVLTIEPQPVRVLCLSCHIEAETDPQHLACPNCHATRTRLLSGDEMLLASVELDLPS